MLTGKERKNPLNFKKMAYIFLLFIAAASVFFASILIPKSFFSTIILKQNRSNIQEDKTEIFEKPKSTKNKKVIKIDLNEKVRKEISVAQAENKKTIYLTIDDGPSSVTPLIRDFLDKEKVKATLFVVGIS